MISTRDIKRKIKTIQNILQMTRAMKTVSLVKLQKVETRLLGVRPYTAHLSKMLAQLLGALEEKVFVSNGKKAVAIITSDKGLCGGYNASVIRRAEKEIELDTPLITLGRKGDRTFRRRRAKILDSLVPLGSEPTFAQIAPFADKISARLETGEISDLLAVYGRFLRGTRSEIVAEEILPAPETEYEVIFEPAPKEMLKLLLKRHLKAALYAAVLESSASEHGARVAAMTAASDNATEMIRDLTMAYNKARQAAITKELTEIVSSAEALA